MFTGIIEELGTVVSRASEGDSAVLRIRGPLVTSDATPGTSIAVNGVCLTVVEHSDDEFTADVMGETLDRSALSRLQPGDAVNLERAVTAQTRLAGHIVQGHVDGVGEVVDRKSHEKWDVVRVSVPASLSRYVVEKGSIAVDGISLTVSAVSPPEDAAAWLEVSLIPTTLALTTLGGAVVGEPVNLEVDVLAKYVERQVAVAAGTTGAGEPA